MVGNRAVARVFKELGLIEQWGTGIPQAVQRLADAGQPAPEFKEFGASLRVIVHIKDHSVTLSTVPFDVPVEASALLGSERAILGVLRAAGSLAAKALVTGTGVSERQVKRILVKLRERGLLRREGQTVTAGGWCWSSGRRTTWLHANNLTVPLYFWHGRGSIGAEPAVGGR